ncbi:MAG: hypothetical protein GW760_08115 [Legionella sp.]|jgi:hypothetical protein|nr:hypothetical protein [Legionella sp.]
MEKSALEQEILDLRQEVERLQAAKSETEPQIHTKPQPTEPHNLHLDKNAKEALSKFLVQAKKDYENLSPATALCLFALGALFGCVLTRGTRSKGEH